MFKRIFLLVGCIVMLSAISYGGALRIPSGIVYDAETPSETVLTISSTAVTTENLKGGFYIRRYQNTGGENINYFYVLSDSNTAGQSYIAASGGTFTEDTYTGTVYFKVIDGDDSSTLSRITYTIVP